MAVSGNLEGGFILPMHTSFCKLVPAGGTPLAWIILAIPHWVDTPKVKHREGFAEVLIHPAKAPSRFAALALLDRLAGTWLQHHPQQPEC